MKYTIPILLLLVTACATQRPPAGPSLEPMPRADKIILTVDMSADEAYRSFAGYLSSNDFTFTNSDEVIRVLKTDFRDLNGNSSIRYRLNANVRADSVTIIQISGAGDFAYIGQGDIENKGMKGSPIEKAWNRLVEIATGFSHQQIYYARN